ncbi:sensor histidine kinase [Pedobacter metabolipauper]|uniref:histidine kinase n=1 Tax=Pedobacter metabolipauper TaxID=425513 RepID=A0A4R6ST60_9SPHI|nr:HAMP domain-containing sensor histidine kinase [Pedobacter metabolipauper]TDQ07083.1 signal transduction histidine kinase [Pedobacter metabolipauper]
MFNLFKYQTPAKYSRDFIETYGYINVRQVRVLSSMLLLISGIVRLIYLFYKEAFVNLTNFTEYNIGNLVLLFGSLVFIILSTLALKYTQGKQRHREILVFFFIIFILTTTFNISYIYSLHNTKNTLTVFLLGIVAVCIFFAVEINQIIIISGYIIILFIVGMYIPNLDTQQKLFNIIAAIILAFVLYLCSRYNYYIRSQHFVQVSQLKQKNEEVQNLNHQKGEILGFVAHDLRNPLNNIESLSRLILSDDAENTEVEMILSSAAHAKNIINDLIEVIQEEVVAMEVQRTDAMQYLKSLIGNWKTNADHPRIINLFSIENEVFISINASKFTRVIDNLISNGLKFSDPGTSINIAVIQADNFCQIRIRDFGIGIPPPLLELLFDQFSKAGRPGLRGEKSIGLGLHISKHIIEQHGGSLVVESKENEGSTFTIFMPLA